MTPTPIPQPHAGRAFRTLSVRTLVLGAFLCPVALMLVIGGIGLWGMSQMAQATGHSAALLVVATRMQWTLGLTLLVAAAATVALGLALSQKLMAPWQALNAAMQRLTAGEQFTGEALLAHYGGQGEIG